MDIESSDRGTNSCTPVNTKSKEGAEKKFQDSMTIYNGHGKVQSRYLRAPIGSCHDLCKYGRKHVSQEEERHLIFRRFMANKIPSDAVQNHVNNGNRRKSSGAKKKAINKSKCQEQQMLSERIKVVIPENLQVDEGIMCSPQAVHPITSEQRTVLLANKNGEPFDELIIAKVSEEKMKSQDDYPKFEDQVTSKDASTIVPSASLEKSIEISPRVIVPECPHDVALLDSSKSKKKQVNKPKAKHSTVKSEIMKKKKTLSAPFETCYAESNISKDKVELEMKDSSTSAKVKVIKQTDTVIRKQSAFPKLQSLKKIALLSSRKTIDSFKIAIPSKVRTPLTRPMSQFNHSKSLNGPMKRKVKASENNEMVRIAEVKLSKPQKPVSSLTPDHSVLSFETGKYPLLKEGFGKNEKVLQVTEPKSANTDNQENFKKGDAQHASESAVKEAFEHPENKQTKRWSLPCLLKDDKRITGKFSTIQSDDGSSNPYKLKFKKGRVVDIHAANAAVPKKLRFRRGRVLCENPNGEFTKRSFNRRRDSGDSNDPNSAGSFAAVTKQHNSEAQGVMLKHQDARGKKDLQALFNHVIEETASKLVETRKSKVKALVGAFETVISLQEIKPVSAV